MAAQDIINGSASSGGTSLPELIKASGNQGFSDPSKLWLAPSFTDLVDGDELVLAAGSAASTMLAPSPNNRAWAEGSYNYQYSGENVSDYQQFAEMAVLVSFKVVTVGNAVLFSCNGGGETQADNFCWGVGYTASGMRWYTENGAGTNVFTDFDTVPVAGEWNTFAIARESDGVSLSLIDGKGLVETKTAASAPDGGTSAILNFSGDGGGTGLVAHVLGAALWLGSRPTNDELATACRSMNILS